VPGEGGHSIQSSIWGASPYNKDAIFSAIRQLRKQDASSQ
jgi:hypothetical protein